MICLVSLYCQRHDLTITIFYRGDILKVDQNASSTILVLFIVQQNVVSY